MKKTLLLSLVVASSLYSFDTFNPFDNTNPIKTAKEIASTFSSSFTDDIPTDACSITNHNCFNAGILNPKDNKLHIQTKVAGTTGGIQLHLHHRAGCGWKWNHHISVALVDNTTGKLITEPKEIDPTTTADDIDVNFNVKNAYKNVSVKFLHLKPLKCEFTHGFRWMHKAQEQIQNQNEIDIHDIINKPFTISGELQCFEVNISNFMYGGEEVACPSDITELQNIIKDNIPTITTFTGNFIYAIPAEDKCYSIENPCNADNPYISESEDSFAIRPDHIEATLPNTNIKAHTQTPINIVVKNANGDTITNYNNSSANLKVTFTDASGNPVDAQYAFEINNGVGSGIVVFSEPVNGVSVSVVDEHFADIDKDDTPASQRATNTPVSSSSSTVSNGGSKAWAGAGTNEAENNPTKNTLDVNIKQNVKKDLHYQKMSW